MKKEPPLSAFVNMLLLSMLLLVFCAVPARAESSWDIQVVDENASGIGNWYCPIAVDADNTPHIAYTACDLISSSSLIYTRWTGTAWENQTVDNMDVRITNTPNYLTVDSDGNPHISYLEVPPEIPDNPRILYLMYATANATEPAEATPTPEVTPTFPDSTLLIVASAIIIGTAIAVIAYVWKKKTKH